MALTQTQCDSFKVELAQGIHNFTTATGDIFKIALFTATDSVTGTYGTATTNYSEMVGDEVVATGYTAGGKALTNITPTSSDGVCMISFSDITWPSSVITTSGAMIYNSSKSNRAVCILNFGADKSSSSDTYVLSITFPAVTSTTAVLRIE